MSKTVQRKKSFYDLGRDDFKYYKYPCGIFGGREMNRHYMRGFNYEKRNHDLLHCTSLLQWFRVKFCMESA